MHEHWKQNNAFWDMKSLAHEIWTSFEKKEANGSTLSTATGADAAMLEEHALHPIVAVILTTSDVYLLLAALVSQEG